MIEAVIALTAGTIASSTALIGFGLDSIIEVASAAAVAWQFSAREHDVRDTRETAAAHHRHLVLRPRRVRHRRRRPRPVRRRARPSTQSVGIVLAALSLAIMPFLSVAQRRAGRELGSATAVADSKQTLLCTYLSAVLLVGLVLNSLFGWSWADPVAALVIAAIAVREGRDAWQGKGCCAPTAAAVPVADAETDACGCGPAMPVAASTTSSCRPAVLERGLGLGRAGRDRQTAGATWCSGSTRSSGPVCVTRVRDCLQSPDLSEKVSEGGVVGAKRTGRRAGVADQRHRAETPLYATKMQEDRLADLTGPACPSICTDLTSWSPSVAAS